ncbi:MAG: hypothetical protein P8J45_14100 [Phycisphaerales bacterium]|nr:hypothetical protein [Phycisphaerales bacterium]
MQSNQRGFKSFKMTTGLAVMSAVVILAVQFTNQPSAGANGEEDQVQLQTTEADFYQPGTQPPPDFKSFDQITSSTNCTYCHAEFNVETAPYDPWVASMMGQSARDPVWHAAVSIAMQDVKFGGETCIRCHAPNAWLSGKSFETELTDPFATFSDDDFDGINCNFCHRAVNPVPCEDPDPSAPQDCYVSGESAHGFPPASGDFNDPYGEEYPDSPIIAALQASGDFPEFTGNASYVVDPQSMRRGPYGPDEISTNWYGVHGATNGHFIWLVESPYHRQSAFCGQCHDVSNPLFMKNPKTGAYDLTSLEDGNAHPTGNPNDMYPEQRTYSEWLISDFAETGVAFDDNRFGGYIPEGSDGLMRSCQDCHMPKQVGAACVFEDNPENPQRYDIGQHSFAGSNTWVVGAVKEHFEANGQGSEITGLTEERVQAAKARTVQMLKDASDMELSISAGGYLSVRIINQTGHKLPTGYPEGRRMWLNIQFYDQDDNLIAESGAYDYNKAALDLNGAKIYEMRAGLSDEVAAATNLPAGESFHLALNNVRLFDNRIPPRGATYAELQSVGAESIPYAYADNQYWDDTEYIIPPETKNIVATLYYQTSTSEYMDFLRNTADNALGSIAHSLWTSQGKSAPEPMDVQALELPVWKAGDINHDGCVDGIDLSILLGSWGPCTCPADINDDGIVDGVDLSVVLGNWGC